MKTSPQHRKIAWGVLLVFCLLGGLTCPAAEPTDRTSETDLIDAVVRPLVEERKILGLVVGGLKDDQERFFTYGSPNLASGPAPTPDTVFEIGSVTKVATALLLSLLQERGHLVEGASISLRLVNSGGPSAIPCRSVRRAPHLR
jgi:CubicO group peptidase (beta-lactamase class C family)